MPDIDVRLEAAGAAWQHDADHGGRPVAVLEPTPVAVRAPSRRRPVLVLAPVLSVLTVLVIVAGAFLAMRAGDRDTRSAAPSRGLQTSINAGLRFRVPATWRIGSGGYDVVSHGQGTPSVRWSPPSAAGFWTTGSVASYCEWNGTAWKLCTLGPDWRQDAMVVTFTRVTSGHPVVPNTTVAGLRARSDRNSTCRSGTSGRLIRVEVSHARQVLISACFGARARTDVADFDRAIRTAAVAR